MLKEYYINEVFRKLDLNCAESVVYSASETLGANLSNESIRLSSAFGGGMYIEEKCGAVTGALMVIGYLFVKENAHATPYLGEIIHYFFDAFTLKMGFCECIPLKKAYRKDEYGCRNVIISALEVLDETMEKFAGYRVR